MRTKQDIKNIITQSFIGNETIKGLYGLVEGETFEQQFSLVSLENILFDVIAYSIYLLELLFVQHKKEVDDNLYNQRSGRLPWYRAMALKFQYGFDLLTDSDEFDNTGATAEAIAASKLIKYSAVIESELVGTIVVKIATEVQGVLSPVAAEVKEAVEAYFDEIRYAGTRIIVINYLPDVLSLNLNIYRDPLVLDENGINIQSGEATVNDAIKAFMKELPFNGELILAHLVDKLQQVEGVRIPQLVEASSSWIDAGSGSYGTSTVINVKRIPESGYYEVTNFDGINYVV